MKREKLSRVKIAIITALGVLMLTAQGFSKPFYFNVSKSLPRGIYLKHLSIPEDLVSRSLVSLKVPQTVLHLTARDWLSKDIPIIKPIVAVSGDHVCISSAQLEINSIYVGEVASHDSKGLPLPQISFCRDLQKEEIWLGSTRIPNSFDSRYFGPVLKQDITCRVEPFFTESI